ncbi:MAG: nuclear transport factor 2 family protein [Gemmatimonadota bacterium]
MNAMKALSSAMVLTLGVLGTALPQDPAPESGGDWEQEVRAAEARHVAVALANDGAGWQALLSDDFIVNSPLNTIVEKPALLEMIRGGVLSLATFEQEIEAVRRFGDIVVVMGEDTAVWAPPSPNAGRTHHRRFTDIWRLEDGDWRFIARQATLVSR